MTEKIISALEKTRKQSNEYGILEIIVPFKELDMIIALLKEQPEIVRCKDCKHAEPVGNRGLRCFMWEYNAVPDNGFCNYGERKENCNG